MIWILIFLATLVTAFVAMIMYRFVNCCDMKKSDLQKRLDDEQERILTEMGSHTRCSV